jgi:hypothetical protein
LEIYDFMCYKYLRKNKKSFVCKKEMFSQASGFMARVLVGVGREGKKDEGKVSVKIQTKADIAKLHVNFLCFLREAEPSVVPLPSHQSNLFGVKANTGSHRISADSSHVPLKYDLMLMIIARRLQTQSETGLSRFEMAFS